MVVHKPLILGHTLRNSTHFWLVNNSFGQYISLQFLSTYYTTMEESLELRIDVSLDQDKDENQEIIYSQNSDGGCC